MKKIFGLLLLVIVMAFPLQVEAQDIMVKRFEINHTSLISRMNQVRDNAGEVCAVFRCYVRGSDYSIEPNMGVVKREKLAGEIRLWVPKGTKRITVRHKGLKPLIGYEIPIRVESKTDYDIDIETAIVEPKEHNVFVGAGYNIMSISGPSLTVGANLKHHIIELGAVYGLNKTDDLYFYDTSGNIKAGFNYNAIRAQLKYGYEIPVSDFFSLTPQVGMAYNAYIGSEVANGNNGNIYENANSLSVLGALKITVSITDNFKLCLTPEYDVAVYKDESCKVISNYDTTMKNWHTGFNLNVGLMVYF